MGKAAKAPPPPDYSGIAKASEESAKISLQISREQTQWAREQYQQDREVSDRVIEASMARMEKEDEVGRADRQRYERVFQPLEKDLADEARAYDVPHEGRQAAKEVRERGKFEAEESAGRAAAEVSRQTELARAAAQDRLEGFGIDPSQVRGGALDLSIRVNEATARAGAANSTRTAITARTEAEAREAQRYAEAKGRAMKSEAINIGRGYPGQVAQAYGTAIQSGSQGVNSGLQTTASGANTIGTGMGWAGAANTSLGTQTGALTAGHNAAVKTFELNQKAKEDQNKAIGSMIGTVAGVAGSMMLSDEREKEGAIPVGETYDGQTIHRFRYKGDDTTQIGLMAQDVERSTPEAVGTDRAGRKYVDYDLATRRSAIPGVGQAPLRLEGGGAIPVEASPSHGAQTDDIKAFVNAGEYIVPKDIVRRKGEEFFEKLIESTRKKQVGGQAVPA